MQKKSLESVHGALRTILTKSHALRGGPLKTLQNHKEIHYELYMATHVCNFQEKVVLSCFLKCDSHKNRRGASSNIV